MTVGSTIVVGAGPAGCSAAITLARTGASVTLLDKADFPRPKTCGDGLTGGALRELERLGLQPTSVESWTEVDAVFVRGPSGGIHRFPLPDDGGLHAVVARREDLDHALLQLAESAGATVHTGAGITGLDRVDGALVVHTADGRSHTGTHVIAADGMWSPTRKLAGHVDSSGYRGDWHAFRAYAAQVTGPAASQLWVLFEPDILPGYFWSFPLAEGRANIGFGIMRDDGIAPGNKLGAVRDMAPKWRELLTRPHIVDLLGPNATLDDGHRAWPIPSRFPDTTLAADGVLYVGDAAAACDPMTGEGIGQALLTGRLATSAILDAPRDAETTYQRTARAALVADHRMSLALGRALAHRKGARVALTLAGATAWTRRNFGRWLFEDYPRAVVLTPRRWKRGMFTPRGAFADARHETG